MLLNKHNLTALYNSNHRKVIIVSILPFQQKYFKNIFCFLEKSPIKELFLMPTIVFLSLILQHILLMIHLHQ